MIEEVLFKKCKTKGKRGGVTPENKITQGQEGGGHS